MGFFDIFFKKKQAVTNLKNSKKTQDVQLNKENTFVSTVDHLKHKIIRSLTNEQRERIHKSTILLQAGQLYMHYWTDHLVCKNPNDPEWQNKVMFFWKAEEPFPKKSLPPIFETFKTKHFLFVGDTSKISLQIGQAIPWFGMPGLGQKHSCEMNGQKITIPELNKIGLVEYIEPVELKDDNLDILSDKDNYFFLIDERITPFQNGNFLLNGIPIPIDVAYSIGGIHIIKKIELEESKSK
ncbi:hypothetical protein B0A78_09140 [Flavobacterium columnare NBRC 100251 = ATCC 23463]|uniref:hypothetical protein n=1 Tax=Flavobacterium columnare TaxID=996 RepID=UPI0007F9D6B6|nr:hypothetical protein [Flavobacterium columnare]ANO48525.1 hypothetical protein Pf1_00277 [Flavobacterium columnare]APT23421.1 hypothetical protein BU993_12785 [Flavobacterium columnare]MBF6652796.1 hypothetical protein [Flavobacterium columnare]OOB83607.1 hypothetical protein BZL53_00520 [Flavobacterium columnare]PDS23519.1 hypothetical protein B0A78_09140 [Flavobacterium columnare NBRC 100251 = ATCC 23463]